MHLHRASKQACGGCAWEITNPRNGCRPTHIHVLSESDVPVRSCSDLHSLLASSPDVSRIDVIETRPSSPSIQLHNGTVNQPILKSSQWLTLTADAARALADDEFGISLRWHSIMAPGRGGTTLATTTAPGRGGTTLSATTTTPPEGGLALTPQQPGDTSWYARGIRLHDGHLI